MRAPRMPPRHVSHVIGLPRVRGPQIENPHICLYTGSYTVLVMPRTYSILERFHRFLFGSKRENEEITMLKLCQDCKFRNTLHSIMKKQLVPEKPLEEAQDPMSRLLQEAWK